MLCISENAKVAICSVNLTAELQICDSGPHIHTPQSTVRFALISGKMRICGSADLRSGKMRRNTADIVCGCYG